MDACGIEGQGFHSRSERIDQEWSGVAPLCQAIYSISVGHAFGDAQVTVPSDKIEAIHGELLKLGFEVSERTVSRYLAQVGRSGDARKRWLVFLKNHREVIAAMDFFAVPTATFRVLYCFFVISHSRRKVLHFNATEHPTSRWIGQRLREAFPDDTAPCYLILDRDRKYEGEVTEVLQSMNSELIQTSYQSRWQNGVAERWVGSCRRELLDHVIVFNESHLRRLVREYLGYYHADRTHDGLGKDTAEKRPIERREAGHCEVVGMPRLGGLN